MRQRADALATRWRRRGHDLQFAAGVSLGFATLGGMGFEGRWEYGPVGPVVHQATELAGEAGPGEVLMSLRARAAADRLVTAEQTRELVRDGLGLAPAFAVTAVEGGGSEPGDLSPREIEVLRLLSEGLSNRGIAARLVISEKTAIRHVSNIFAKLGVHSRAAATREAVTRGIAEESPPSG
jgi:DNA-binding CsgD family transcriptional regulator